MADFYFFTDLHLLERQKTSGEFLGMGFGPPRKANSTGRDYDLFSLCSIHTAENHLPSAYSGHENPTAYAVCAGTIFCLESRNPKFVDIILRPKEQPHHLPTIKYYIYRGVMKESLVDSANDIIPDSDPLANDLSRKLHHDGYTNGIAIGLAAGGLADLSDTSLGVTLSTDSYLDDLFDLNLSDSSGTVVQQFEIDAGMSLGYFPRRDEYHNSLYHHFGFQILLNATNFHPTVDQHLSNAIPNDRYQIKKSIAHVIRLKDFPTDAGAYPFIEENNKEYILNYLDPCAYYGNFAYGTEDRLLAYDLQNPSTIDRFWLNNAETVQERAEAIHVRLQLGYYYSGSTQKVNAVNFKFENAKRIYVDLRNQYGLSFNYFHNFGKPGFTTADPEYWEDLKISWQLDDVLTTEQGLSSRNYTSGAVRHIYPYLWLHEKSFSPDYEVPKDKVLDNHHLLHLNIAFRKDKDQDKACYSTCIHYGLPVREDDRRIFDTSTSSVQSDHTQPIKLQIAHHNPQTTTSIQNRNHPICQYVRLSVMQHPYEIPATTADIPLVPGDTGYVHPDVPRLRDHEYLDHVMVPFEDCLHLMRNGRVPWRHVYPEAHYWDNTSADGMDYVGSPGVAFDRQGGDHLTLFISGYHRRFQPLSLRGANFYIGNQSFPIQSGTVGGGFLHELEHQINDLTSTNPKMVVYEDHPAGFFTDSDLGTTPKIRSFYTRRENPLPTDNVYPFPNGFTAITIPFADYQTILQAYDSNFQIPDPADATRRIKDLRGFPTYIAFRNDGFYTNSSRQRYTRFEIILRGFARQAADDKIVLSDVPTGVYHYVLYPSYSINDSGLIAALAGESPQGSSHFVEYQHLPPLGERYYLQSDLHFIRGLHMSWEDMVHYRDYFEQNVSDCWDSRHNLGLWELTEINTDPVSKRLRYNSLTPVTFVDTQIQPQLYIRFSCPEDLRWIPPRTGLLSVERSADGAERSNIANRRRGQMYARYNPIMPTRNMESLYSTQGNTAGHEFGHMMGLADRYCFAGQVFQNGSTGDFTVLPDSETDTNGQAVTLFVHSTDPQSDDPYYNQGYRWKFNLFSYVPNQTLENLADAPFKDQNGDVEMAFTNEFQFYRPSELAILGVQQAVFVTPYQWQFIKNYEDEPNYLSGSLIFGAQYGFFKQVTALADPADEFNGSFIGLNNGTIVTDDALPATVTPGQSIPDMIDRINPAIPYIGYLHIEAAPGWVRSSATVDDIEMSGKDTVLREISENNLLPDTDYNLTDNSPTAEPFQGDLFNIEDIGLTNGDANGQLFWETEDPTALQEPNGVRFIFYNLHSNRRAIIELLGRGGW